MRIRYGPVALLLAAAGCELQEIVIAQPDDIVVAEVVLAAGEPVHTAWLHHTRVSDRDADPRVPGAAVAVRDEDGAVLDFRETADSLCYIRRGDAGTRVFGTCYVSDADSMFVQPGRTYQLAIVTADGRELGGVTTVPGDFDVVQPAGRALTVPPNTNYRIAWTQSGNAWVYVIDAWLHQLRDAVAPIRVPRDPLLLSGLSISGRDTTIVFPRELGIFDRFERDLTEVVVALQDGLPENVDSEIVISAADRNYVNWVRAGSFNPSGQVRVPSIHGDGGTGVFGSVVQRTVFIRARRDL